jgi:lysophospholipase L1-like esterase
VSPLTNFERKLDSRSPVGILIVGDSIARGDEAEMPSRSFVVIWADEVARSRGVRVSITNFSQGGNTADDALRMLRIRRERAASIADLVMIAVGMNDAAARSSVRRFARTVGKMIKISQTAGADVLLVSPCTPMPEYAVVDEYRDELERQARATQCLFADVTTVWKQRGGPHLLRNDLNHPNDEGHRLYAETLLATIH